MGFKLSRQYRIEIKFLLWALPIVILISWLCFGLADTGIKANREWREYHEKYKDAVIYYLYK